MTGDIERLVASIHASPKMAVVTVAGAGGQALAWLLGVPGASRTVLEAVVPYGRKALTEFLGHEPNQHVSLETAKEMAEAAYERGLRFREGGEPVVGLACTASIATDRPKRGEHRCCIATWDDSGVTTYALNLAKGQRDRPAEEEVVSRLVLRALAESCGVGLEIILPLLQSERLEVQRVNHADPLRRLLAPEGEGHELRVRTLTVHPDGHMAADEPFRGGVLPGSFQPLHQGHERLARVASEMLSVEVAFEISVVNVDKPPLEEEEARRRLSQFQGKWSVVLTRAPTFREKAPLFPGCTFVIGWDTAVRLVHPRYYAQRKMDVASALGEIRAEGCRFLVAGRLKDGVFRSLVDVAIPEEFTDMFQAIPESRFRLDVSSTELRSAKLGR